MTESPDVEPQRRARMRRIVAVAGALGVLGAAAVGLGGGTGRAGLAVLLLFGAVGCAAGALYGLVTAVVDEARGRSVGRGRIGWALGLFVGGVLLMAMVAGVGG